MCVEVYLPLQGSAIYPLTFQKTALIW